MNKKTVAMPIEVPNTNYCWANGQCACEHFDNEGGHPTCTLGFWIRDKKAQDGKGYRKPDECLNLKEIDNA